MGTAQRLIWLAMAICTNMGQAIAASPYDHFHIRSGVLTGNTAWEGKNMVIADVVVPTGSTLTILPGTWIVFHNGDLDNRGLYPEKSEVIVQGKLELPENEKDSIRILDIRDPLVRPYLTGGESLEIKPEAVDLRDLKEEWRGFKHQYAIVWALIYSIALLL